ncbi:MAG: glyoxalase [Colwellia sp.]|jgi:hypothetical protein
MIEIDAMFPVMVAGNLEAVKQYYETVFGFKTVFYDANFYLHIISANNNIQLGFLVPNLASQPEFLHPIMAADGFVISFEVKDATLAFSEAQKMGLNFALPLKQEEWGQIHFMVKDPAGLRIDVVQHLEPTVN